MEKLLTVVPPFSLHDLVGYCIPTKHGVVNAIYSPTSTRVEPYYTHVSDPHVLPFTPMFVGLSLVSMRKANYKDKPKGGRNALAAAAAPETETKIAGGSGEGEVAGGSGSGEGDRGGDGGGIGAVDLNENENSAKETGYSCRR